jgi:hypothetical protein
MTRKMTVASAVLVAVSGLLFAAARAAADQPTYKCVQKSRVTYTQLPCPGGKQLGMAPVRRTDRSRPVPQDRAVVARRAALSPEDRWECKALDGRLREQAAELKAKGEAVTLQDEMPLVQSRKKYREMRC